MYRYEIKKIFYGRFAVLWLFILFLIPAYHILGIYTESWGDDWLPNEYNDAVEKGVPGKSAEESLEWLEKDIEESLFKNGENKKGERALYNEIKQTVEYQKSIQKIMAGNHNGLMKNAENGYSVRSSLARKNCYQKMEEVNPKFSRSYGIGCFLRTGKGEYLISFLLLFLVLSIVMVESDYKMNNLLLSLHHGKKRLIHVKYSAGCFISVPVVLFLELFKLWIYVWAYKFSEWDALIQSVPGYWGVPWKMSVLAFVCLFLFIKIMGFIVLYSLFFLIAVSGKNVMGVLLFELAFLFGGICLITYIDANSWIGFLNLFSPVRFVDIQKVLAGYQLCNILGYPVPYLLLWFGYFFVCFLAVLILIWGKQEISYQDSPSFLPDFYNRIFRGKQRLWKERGNGRSSQRFWELYKSLFLEKGGLFLLAGFGLVIIFYHPPREYIFDTEEIYFKGYLQQYIGEYTEAKSRNISAKYQELHQLQEDMDAHPEKYKDNVVTAADEMLKKLPAAEAMLEYGKYLGQYSKSAYVNEKGWGVLLGEKEAGSYLWLCDALGLLCLLIISVRCWGEERWSGMDLILRPTCRSERYVSCKKTGVIFFNAVLIGGIVYVPWIFMVCRTYLLQGQMQYSAASIRGYSVFSGMPIFLVATATYFLRIMYLYLVGILAYIPVRWTHKRNQGQVVAVLMMWILSMLILVWRW